MNMKKILSCAAAAALSLSMMSIAADAADWSKTGYADNDPNTVNIISTSADGVTFTATADGAQAKARITLSDVLADPADVSKIYSGSWDVTYSGLESFNGTDVAWLGGGCYAATCNSTGYGLSPVNWTEDGLPVWDDVQTVQDTFKYLLPANVPTDAAAAEFVFIDWSGQPFVTNGVTVTISNFKLFDADGNEIAQKDYAAAESAPAAEEAPAADTTTTSTATGNTAAASIAAVMAVAGAAAVAAKKRK